MRQPWKAAAATKRGTAPGGDGMIGCSETNRATPMAEFDDVADGLERKLATILSADVAAYSRLMATAVRHILCYGICMALYLFVVGRRQTFRTRNEGQRHAASQ